MRHYTLEEKVKITAAAVEMFETFKLIAVYCKTPQASGYDDIFLQRLKAEHAPIIKECERIFAQVGVKV